MMNKLEIDLNKIEYHFGISYKEAITMLNRSLNNLYEMVIILQNRVLELEKKEK